MNKLFYDLTLEKMSLNNTDLFQLRKSKKSVVFAQESSTAGSLFKYIGGNSLLTKNVTFEHNGENSQIYQSGEMLHLETSNLLINNGNAYINSKGLVGNQGYTVGATITKDMNTTGCDSLPAEYAPNGVAIQSGQTSSYWDDWGGDIFDDWGFFYLFDTASNQYYFPIFNPENLDDGTFTTQTFSAFGRSFTITHGYPAQGIFKFDISCADSNEFIFGAYGNMGSDGSTINTNFTQSYSLNGSPYTLYYNRNIQSGSLQERFFSYFIPYETSLNTSKTYNDFLDGDDLSLFTVPVRHGVTVYFSKTNDVKDWVINDLQSTSTTVFIDGPLVVNGTNLGRLSVNNMTDADYTPTASSLVNGYFTSSNLFANRNFTLPTAVDILEDMMNLSVGTSFSFTINNVQANNYARILQSPDSSIVLSPSILNTSVTQNKIIRYLAVVTSIAADNEQIVIYQDAN